MSHELMKITDNMHGETGNCPQKLKKINRSKANARNR